MKTRVAAEFLLVLVSGCSTGADSAAQDGGAADSAATDSIVAIDSAAADTSPEGRVGDWSRDDASFDADGCFGRVVASTP